MRTCLVAAAAAVGLITLFHHDAAAVCHGNTQPVFSDVQLAAPDGGVIKGRIAYAQGTRLDVSFTLPACTMITNVYEDGLAVFFQRWGEAITLPDGRVRHTMRIYSGNDGRGRALSLRLAASATSDYQVNGPGPTADLVVTRVGVVRANGRVGITVSEAEIRNRLLMRLYSEFGLSGTSHQSGMAIYDPSYDLYDEPTVIMLPGASHSYKPPQLAIEPGKIHFAYRLMASIDNWCDPTVRVHGTFHLEVTEPIGPQGRFVHAVWDGNGAVADISFPIYCQAPQAVLGVDLWVVPYYSTSVEEEVVRIVQDAIDDASGLCPHDPVTGARNCTGINPFVTAPSVALEKDQIRIELGVPESVTIEVPYRAGGVDAPATTGFPLNNGDRVVMMAQNLATVCEQDWSGQAIGACAAVRSGPQGMYNAAGNSPFTYPSLGTGSLTGYEDDVFGGLAQLHRDRYALPLPYENAGALLVRLASTAGTSRPMPAGMPCTVSADAFATTRVALGINDHRTAAGGELGYGSFLVNVVWPGVFPAPASCGYEVGGAIVHKYNVLGGAAGFMGLPHGDELDTLSHTGRMSHFEGGTIMWQRPNTNAFAVIHGIRVRYADMGWEMGPLGYPIADEGCSVDNACRARVSRFEHGTILWTPAAGTRAVVGPINDKWNLLGATGSVLGLPTTEEIPVTYPGQAAYVLGRRQEFEAGAISWSSSTGAHEVRNGIFAKWVAMGRENGVLGFPTTDEDCTRAPGCFNDFQNGSIYWHPSYGMHEIRGAIRSYWLARGGVASTLGWPTSDQIWLYGYPAYRFELGTLVDFGPIYGGVWSI